MIDLVRMIRCFANTLQLNVGRWLLVDILEEVLCFSTSNASFSLSTCLGSRLFSLGLLSNRVSLLTFG